MIITQFRFLKLKGPKRAPEHSHFGVPLSYVEAGWERGHDLLPPSGQPHCLGHMIVECPASLSLLGEACNVSGTQSFAWNIRT